MTEAHRTARLHVLRQRAAAMGVAGEVAGVDDPDDDEEIPQERVPRELALEAQSLRTNPVGRAGSW